MTSLKLETRQFRLNVDGANDEEVISLVRRLREEGFLQTDRMASGVANPEVPLPPPAVNESPGPQDDGERIFDAGLGQAPATAPAPTGSGNDPCELAVSRRPDGLAVRARLGPGNGGQEVGASSLILMGAEAARGENSVTAASLTKWIRLTGYQVDRIDREIQPFMDAGFVLAQGRKRGKRYLLTETGRQEARRYARDLLARLGGSQQ